MIRSANFRHSSSEISGKMYCSPSWAEITIPPVFTRQIESSVDTHLTFVIGGISFTMSKLDSLLSVLRLWPTWKKIESTPERINTLENRVAELESRLARCPGEGCPRCGELAFRVQTSTPHPNIIPAMIHHMKCGKCGFEDQHVLKP